MFELYILRRGTTVIETSQGYHPHKAKGISYLSNQLPKLVQIALMTFSDSQFFLISKLTFWVLATWYFCLSFPLVSCHQWYPSMRIGPSKYMNEDLQQHFFQACKNNWLVTLLPGYNYTVTAGIGEGHQQDSQELTPNSFQLVIHPNP
jgi:hypothetical protein